ncbi:unnamed protein product [Cuscuta campestris]|uniref:Uncharacterized protein n=2 Tax=Cuscuta sect. Cleistogrammica TaxID=1824901 RepID=A0A484K954_9ASTE|nr:hypothetical protein DM860_008421 [Cuscuta australis]VFQ58336.1 unnamed protein product [Cuscuta campestris]
MMKIKAKTESGFRLCIKAPLRVVKRARDLYIRSLWDCSDKLTYSGGALNLMGCPAPAQLSPLPRSFSALSSEDEDLSELVRVASRRRLRGKEGPDRLWHVQPLKARSAPGRGGLPSAAVPAGRRMVVMVAIARIDEDKPCV